MTKHHRLALVASDTERAQDAARAMATQHDWVPLEEADAMVVLGGDGVTHRVPDDFGVDQKAVEVEDDGSDGGGHGAA